MIFRKTSIGGTFKALTAILGMLCASTSLASTSSRNLTVTPTKGFEGITIVDQLSGASRARTLSS
jgi:hypothetical protein